MANVVTVSELRQKTAAEQTKLLHELREQLREAHFAQRAGTLRKVHRVRVLRRSIAKILTVQRSTSSTKQS